MIVFFRFSFPSQKPWMLPFTSNINHLFKRSAYLIFSGCLRFDCLGGLWRGRIECWIISLNFWQESGFSATFAGLTPTISAGWSSSEKNKDLIKLIFIDSVKSEKSSHNSDKSHFTVASECRLQQSPSPSIILFNQFVQMSRAGCFLNVGAQKWSCKNTVHINEVRIKFIVVFWTLLTWNNGHVHSMCLGTNIHWHIIFKVFLRYKKYFHRWNTQVKL